jgi:DNA-binding XRE family transcriptional regulator
MVRKKRRGRTVTAERAAFAARLRQARERSGKAAVDVADEIGAARSTYYSWEEGTRAPRDVKKLAEAIGTTVGALHGEVPL